MFRLFGYTEPKLKLCEKELNSRYRSLVSQVHPDKCDLGPSVEPILTHHVSTLTNAVLLLRNPVDRANLVLNHYYKRTSPNVVDPSLLIEVMELEENSSKESLNKLLKLQDEFAFKFETAFKEERYSEAETALTCWRLVERVASRVKDVL